MEYPRVLIVSNDCLSLSSSNGRTLRNFLVGWPKEKLAQFYLQPGTPDPAVCANGCRVSDGQALRAFLGRGGAETGGGGAAETGGPSGGVRRNALTMLVRELVWNSRRWMTADVHRWVEDFRPEVILLQAGDCGFMLRLAEDLSARFGAPLVIYNSEGYYFKDYDYFRAKGPAHWCYPVFSGYLRRCYRRTLPRAAGSIYNCAPLEQAYDRAFGLPSGTIYTATQVSPRETEPENPVFRTAYLGNLGVGRHEGLIQIAQALHEISPELYLDVYGAIPTDEVRQALSACPGIRYRGIVPYDQVLRVMEECDLLVHTESFDDFYREDSRFAFSTKLADSLASGVCFLLYAPEDMACARYLKENEAAWVVSERAELRETLRLLVERPEERARYLKAAAALVERNHSAEKNAARFQELLCQAAEKGS